MRDKGESVFYFRRPVPVFLLWKHEILQEGQQTCWGPQLGESSCRKYCYVEFPNTYKLFVYTRHFIHIATKFTRKVWKYRKVELVESFYFKLKLCYWL